MAWVRFGCSPPCGEPRLYGPQVHDKHRVLDNRINRELMERIVPAETIEYVALDVSAHDLPGEPMPVGQLDGTKFEPVAPGHRWGRPWGTTWFRVGGEIPPHLLQEVGATRTEVSAELGFSAGMVGFQAEGAVYVDGLLRCGVHPRRRAIPLDTVRDGDRVDFMIEAAANPDFSQSFSPSPLGSLSTAGGAPLYTFGGVRLVVVDLEVRRLLAELSVLNGTMRSLPAQHRRRQRLQAVFQRCFDTLDPADVRGTASAARSELAAALEVPAAAGSHEVSAIGHAHIDTAWLWPLRETRRKVARTFANQIQLMDQYPEHRFAASQAVHYSWIEEEHPELFGHISDRVASGQWLPVGGMWVEADMNLPSGESLVRQMVHGQRYFESRFGNRCREVWIPDVFGYPGNLPQIFAAAGCDRFVTQKLSWNKQNRFPHHTFVWEGLDGTEILAHFPPVDTYNAEIQPNELSHAVRNFADHAWSDHSLMPFGHGDGGGGPTREMLERARLVRNLSELPRLVIEGPAAFFDRVDAEVARYDVPRWRGELYFEMHRGTFTTQARTKVGNRRCEAALREAELWLATVGDDSHASTLDTLWKRVLTQQFHDILPGSSIAWVHDDAEREHREVLQQVGELTADVLERLSPGVPTVANAATHRRREVVAAGEAPPGDGVVQVLHDGRVAFGVDVPGLGLAEARACELADRVEVSAVRLANSWIDVAFDGGGNVVSIRDLRADRELVPPGRRAAELTLAPDTPVEFDAWDLEQWTAARARPVGDAVSVEVIESGPLIGAVKVRREFGSSWVDQSFVLRAGSARLDVALEIEWQESEKLLAINFPLDIRADRAACEVQFGHEYRPTHANTSWDDAKFEVCAQRWVDLSEPGFGAAVLNDGRHGHAVQDGGIRVSLLRAPLYPDPTADRGRHKTTVSLLSHSADLTAVVAEAEALNLPLRVVTGGSAEQHPDPVVVVDDPRIQVSAVKLADDGSGDLIVRVWESTGDRVRFALVAAGGVSAAVACNALEEPLGHALGPSIDVADGSSVVVLPPFTMATLRLTAL